MRVESVSLIALSRTVLRKKASATPLDPYSLCESEITLDLSSFRSQSSLQREKNENNGMNKS